MSALFSLSPALLQAQQQRGTVSGVVTDNSGAILPGALVVAVPSGKRAVSDTQGAFRISDLPSGTYTLTCTYVGFSPGIQTVDLMGDGGGMFNPVLKPSFNSEITVTSERLRGQAEAINIQRTSEDIVQVLPAKVINSLPNTNIADAVGRLPSVTLERDEGEGKYVQIRGTEPRLSNTTINGVNVPSPEGNVRNVKLDVIPAALVERIEVSKTLSANQDGDAIGGSVNLVTKTASEKPTFDFGLQGGYTPIQDGRWLDNFDATSGRRFGANHRYGLLFGGTYDHNERGINDLEPLPKVLSLPDGTNIASFQTADLRTYKYYRTRYGFAGGTDFQVRPGTQLYMKGLFSDFHDYGDTFVYTPTVGNVLSQSGSVTTFDNQGTFAYRHYVRRPDQQIFSILTGVDQNWNTVHVTADFAGSRGHTIGGQDFATTFFQYSAANPKVVQFSVDTKDPLRPQFNVTNQQNVLDPSQYNISGLIIPKSHSTQLNFEGSASLAKLYNVQSHFGSFEFGVKVRNAHKTQNQADQNYIPALDANGNVVSTPTLAQGTDGTANPNYYDGSYKFGPLTNYSRLQGLYLSNRSLFTPDDGKGGTNGGLNNVATQNSVGATYDANERVSAGYLMNSITFNKFRIQTGIRIEATGASYNANSVVALAPVPNDPANPNQLIKLQITPTPGSSSYINLLPSVQVQYQIDQSTNLRASYGRGLSRPNFQDIVPSSQTDQNTTPPSVVKGNPALVATTANNFDLLGEHFFKGLGLVQGGFFYKALTNPIYNTTQNSTDVAGRQIQIKQSVNGPNAYILGIELAYQQRLSFLPGLLSGVGVDGNYSYTTSQVTFPAAFGRTDTAALLRQAPNTYNVGMTYDRQRFSMRFGLSHNDANIYSYAYPGGNAATNADPIVGLKGPNGDQYLYAHTQYDIQGSYRLKSHLSLVVSGLNLSNEVFGFYLGSPQYPIQREFYKPSVLFGFRWSSSGDE